MALLPGSCFGRPVEELSLRLAYVDFDGARALEAAARRLVDEAFIKEHCGRVTTAIDRMADWIAA